MTRGRARRPVARRHVPRHVARPETGAGDAQRVRRDVAGVALLPCTRELLQAETRS